MEFFTVQIRNPNTRRSYAKAAMEFLHWCESRNVRSVGRHHAYPRGRLLEELTRSRAAPMAKQRLAAVRHLFYWLVKLHASQFPVTDIGPAGME
ncbi:site-specific integrase [Rhizobium sp. YK2]|uniref:site-specific integrase n=1 Tax=Rhizobium sp. YK2 TaxID=1860096 RepID=UPI00084C7F4D|nr:site-specific integrase [Rhizobium sp. YK2]OED00944.1 hypothetical protein A9Z06_13480 [Rhizobium sp. YK2]